MEFYTSVLRKSNQILYRGIRDGEDVLENVHFKPTLYMKSMKTDGDFKDFYGGNVTAMTFESIYDMSQFAKNYGSIPGELWGNKNPVPQFIYEKFGSKIEYNQHWVRGAFIDIEVLTRQRVGDTWLDGGFPEASKAEFPINAICYYDTSDCIYHVYSLAPWRADKSCFKELADQVDYHFFKTEMELLEAWISYVRNNYPHYVTGWNIEKFDIPYIVNRVEKVLGPRYVKLLSPWNIVQVHDVMTKYGSEQTYELYGISTLDYMDLYKKHIFTPRESYTLDFIAECELNEHKKEFEGTHGSFFWEDPQGFQDYNIKDVNLVVKMDDKLQLVNLVLSLAYFAGINYEETFSPIRTWDTLIYRECMNRHIAVPFRDQVSAREEYEGAYVVPPKVGMYKAIASFDVTSLYPSVNRSWNIGTEALIDGALHEEIKSAIIEACVSHNNSELAHLALTSSPFVEYYKDNGMPDYVTEVLKKYNVSLTLNWQFFSNEKEAITTYLQSTLFLERKSDKKKAQEYAQIEKSCHEEMLRRGLINE